jgi:hypothetical protein
VGPTLALLIKLQPLDNKSQRISRKYDKILTLIKFQQSKCPLSYRLSAKRLRFNIAHPLHDCRRSWYVLIPTKEQRHPVVTAPSLYGDLTATGKYTRLVSPNTAQIEKWPGVAITRFSAGYTTLAGSTNHWLPFQ